MTTTEHTDTDIAALLAQARELDRHAAVLADQVKQNATARAGVVRALVAAEGSRRAAHGLPVRGAAAAVAQMLGITRVRVSALLAAARAADS